MKDHSNTNLSFPTLFLYSPRKPFLFERKREGGSPAEARESCLCSAGALGSQRTEFGANEDRPEAVPRGVSGASPEPLGLGLCSV